MVIGCRGDNLVNKREETGDFDVLEITIKTLNEENPRESFVNVRKLFRVERFVSAEKERMREILGAKPFLAHRQTL